MIETREKIIRAKVFKKIDIINIWNIINKEYLNFKKEKEISSIRLSLNCSDWTRYESEIDDLIADGNIIDIKNIKSINIEFYYFKQIRHQRRICISLRHGDSNDNELIVTGEDRTWVGGKFKEIEDLLESVAPQEHWILKYSNFLFFIGFILLGIALCKILYITFSPNTPSLLSIFKSRDILGRISMFAFPFFLGSIIMWKLLEWIVKLWPSIEFDFGPEHEKIEKNRRLRIGTFFTIIILPLIFNFIPNNIFIKDKAQGNSGTIQQEKLGTIQQEKSCPFSLTLLTDKNIYKPGQTMGVSYHVNNISTVTLMDVNARLEIRGMQLDYNTKYGEKNYLKGGEQSIFKKKILIPKDFPKEKHKIELSVSAEASEDSFNEKTFTIFEIE